MASTVKNLSPNNDSHFYADESSGTIVSEESMQDNFYKEAAKEVLRDAATQVQSQITHDQQDIFPKAPGNSDDQAPSSVSSQADVGSSDLTPEPASEPAPEPVPEPVPEDDFDDLGLGKDVVELHRSIWRGNFDA